MITALLLIFDPSRTWQRIMEAKRGVLFVLVLFLLPTIALTCAAEGWLVYKFGADDSALERNVAVAPALAIRYAATQAVLALLVVIIATLVVQKVADNFHGNHTFRECFAVVAYGYSPFLLFRLLDGAPRINTWICFGLGILLAVGALYQGLPRLLRPDPAKALGLYMACSVVLTVISGLGHFVAVMVLEEKLFANGFGF